jgi:hypothetical protein
MLNAMIKSAHHSGKRHFLWLSCRLFPQVLVVVVVTLNPVTRKPVPSLFPIDGLQSWGSGLDDIQ